MSIHDKQLTEVFVELADTLVDDFDLVEFLQSLTGHAARLVETDACGLLLADDSGRLQLMAASNEQVHLLELFGVQAVEGPCQDCFRQGAAVVDADLALAAGRWPRFAPRAVSAGFRSVHAFPLRSREVTLGAMSLFSTRTGPMCPADAKVVQALADVATIGLLQERAIRRSEILSEQLHTALVSRIAIEQAKGVLAQIHGITPDEAFQVLRSHCRSSSLRLGAVALALVNDPGAVPGLTSPQSPV